MGRSGDRRTGRRVSSAGRTWEAPNLLKTPLPTRCAHIPESPGDSAGSANSPPHALELHQSPGVHANTPELWPEVKMEEQLGGCTYSVQPCSRSSCTYSVQPLEQRMVWGEYGENSDAVPPGWSANVQPSLWGEVDWPPVPSLPGGWAPPVGAPPVWKGKGAPARVEDRGRKGKNRPRRQRSLDQGKGGPTVANFAWMGRILALAREPTTSRLMQKELRDSAQVEGLVLAVVQEIAPGFASLMGDPVGNYFCQALVDVADGEQLEILVQNCTDSIVQIALSRHGTCAVQRLMHASIQRAPRLASLLIGGIAPWVVKLTNNLHGHYVIQCCLSALEPGQSAFILGALRGHCAVVASHRQGCLVLQKCFDRRLDADLDRLAQEVADQAYKLAQDPFGNYVVQHVLKKARVQKRIAINLMPHLIPLSAQKFSSNVVELCFSVSDPPTRSMLVDQLLTDPEGLGRLVKDQFGNYVMQSVLAGSTNEQVDGLLEMMRPALEDLEQTPNGRRVLANLHKKCRRVSERAG